MKKILFCTLLISCSLGVHADERHNLMISVKNNNQVSGVENNSGFSGGIRRGKVYVGTGKPVPTQQDGATIRSEGLAYSTSTTTRTSTSNMEQQLRALEGSPAFIYTGESRLIPTRDAYGNIQSTQVSANKGFYINATLSGERVILEISVSNDEFDQAPGANSSQDTLSTQRLSTTVSGRVGEWIALGGITLSDTSNAKSLAKKTTADTTTLGDISVKIIPIH